MLGGRFSQWITAKKTMKKPWRIMLMLVMWLSGTVHAADSLTVVFTGDLLLGRDVGRMVKWRGADWLFTHYIDSVFASSDRVVANLECPSTAIQSPLNKRFVFNSDPRLLATLRRHGITHLNLANNHTIDQGRNGLTDTYSNVQKNGMTAIGYGRNAVEAAKPVLLAESPRKVFVLSSLRVISENYVCLPERPCVCEASISQLQDSIQALKARDSTACVIVCLHWGVEHTVHPTVSQRNEAHRLVDAGADAIVGHHSHTAQDVETYRGRPIYYSLGNFIFDLDRQLNRRALLARIVVTKDGVAHRSLPIEIRSCRPCDVGE